MMMLQVWKKQNRALFGGFLQQEKRRSKC